MRYQVYVMGGSAIQDTDDLQQAEQIADSHGSVCAVFDTETNEICYRSQRGYSHSSLEQRRKRANT